MEDKVYLIYDNNNAEIDFPIDYDDLFECFKTKFNVDGEKEEYIFKTKDENGNEEIIDDKVEIEYFKKDMKIYVTKKLDELDETKNFSMDISQFDPNKEDLEKEYNNIIDKNKKKFTELTDIKTKKKNLQNKLQKLKEELENIKKKPKKKKFNITNIEIELKKLTGENIPTLNALVKSDKSHLPSEGFSYVSEDYANMTLEDKKTYVMGLNAKAIQYNKWDWVLASLGLTPSTIIEDIEIIREKIKKGYKSGGESPYHKNLKEYICNHPKIVGIKDEAITKNETEHQLLSGDKLDVYFETYDGSKIAVEVKSRISDDLDITRGLFQCIKYQSILDAESRANSEEPKNSVFLVLEGQLSVNNRRIRDVFNINVIENVRIM